LVGEDGDFVVYDGSTELHRVEVFQDQPIHGLRVHRDDDYSPAVRILAWGASYISLLDASPLDASVPPVILATISAPDWIYDAAVSPWDPALAALATAHNEVLTLRYHADTRTLTLGAMASPSRPMLYTSHVTWTSEGCVLVAAGTVFGDVIVWKYHVDATHTLLYVLRGHEGSIYGVDISPELPLADGSKARLVATCSDDRTIRVWDISEQEPHESTTVNGVLETGFKAAERYDEVQTSAEGEIAPVAVAMGHLSRIWGVKFAVHQGQVVVYSFGEDSTTQRWRLSLDTYAPLRGSLAHEHTYALHNGKHLWARAVSIQPGVVKIVTGGADSKISLVEERWASEEEGGTTSNTTIDVPDLLRTLPNPCGAREMISRYDFITDDAILAITNLGRLFLGSLSRRQEWEEIAAATPDLKLCYVLREIGHGAAVIGTTNGKILFVQNRHVTLVGSVPGRVAEINRLCTTDSDTIDLLVHLHGSPSSRYWTLSPTGDLRSEHQVAGLDARFVPVSAARLDDLLIIGSRHGYVSLLTLRNSSWQPILDAATRSRDAITSIVPLPASQHGNSPSKSSYILATSRDGKYRIYQIHRTDDVTVSLGLLHETSPPLGPMIEGAWFTNTPTPELLLYGFRSKDFVIWNESTRQELATVDCGGAHRTFRLSFSAEEPERYRFAYTRTSKLSIFSQTRMPHCTLKSGTHGREIRALSASERHVASGAEDTSIRIWEYVGATVEGKTRAEMRYLACMKAHVTGIQKLHWFEDDYLLSSAGNEEFFVWRVRSLDSAYAGLAVVCEGIFADKSPLGDLRIMDFDVSRTVNGRKIAVTLAFSNSTIKTYGYTNDGRFELMSSGLYTGACITQLRHLGQADGQLWVLTASTDGYMALWHTQIDSTALGNFTMQGAAQVHQSSIKSLDMTRDDGVFRILTGGDDNGIGFTEVAEMQSEAGSKGYRFATRGVVRRAHGAAINGVALLPQGKDDGAMLGVSISNDQRLKLWRIMKNGPRRIELASCMSSGVADPGDIVVVRRGNSPQVVLGGVGVEAWSVLS
jgi:WD40 repeat protein